MNKLLVLFGVLVLSTLLLSGCMASGEDAEKMINDAKLTFKKKIDGINVGTTYKVVLDSLGVPDRGEGTARPSWKPIPGDNLNQVAVYLHKNRVRKIKWFKVGVFMWEKSFTETKDSLSVDEG